MKSLRVGVIGAGYWGPNIIRNLAAMPETTLYAVCDARPERLDPVRRQFPLARITTNTEDIFSDPAIDAVAIATPVSTHYEIARAALLAGKHVFIEKPLTDNSADARELIRLAQRKKRTLMVDHVFIYSPPVQMIKRLMQTNKLGESYYFGS